MPSKPHAMNPEFIHTVSSVRKSNIRSLRNIIERYLGENWTHSYLDKLEAFIKAISTRVNQTIKLKFEQSHKERRSKACVLDCK